MPSETTFSQVYRLNPAVAIEDFGERSLALHCTDLRLIELNTTARDLLSRLNGRASLNQIAATVAKDYGQSLETVLTDIQATMAQMLELNIAERMQSTLEVDPILNRQTTVTEELK